MRKDLQVQILISGDRVSRDYGPRRKFGAALVSRGTGTHLRIQGTYC